MAQKKQKTISTVTNKVKNNASKFEKEILSIIAKVARVKPAQIKDETNLRDELGISSLNAMEILAAVETKYGIQVDEAKAFDVATAKDLHELVKSYIKT